MGKGGGGGGGKMPIKKGETPGGNRLGGGGGNGRNPNGDIAEGREVETEVEGVDVVE